jgi:hypothetical protein
MRRVKARVLEVLPVSPSVAKASKQCQNTAHELGIATKPARTYTYRGSRGRQ